MWKDTDTNREIYFDEVWLMNSPDIGLMAELNVYEIELDRPETLSNWTFSSINEEYERYDFVPIECRGTVFKLFTL